MDNYEMNIYHNFLFYIPCNLSIKTLLLPSYVVSLNLLQLVARPAKLVRDCEMSAPETTILYPDRGGNIHTFRAITPCALFDVLSPPYSAEEGRDCSYFRKSLLKEPPVVLPSEIDSSEVVWLEELEDHLPPEGFVVARGLYKGPVIRR
ncbi:hypothetical protein PR202_ga11636 [Eleusine coracana subsp. coracana]|uniref:cysteine dioxygenase n=1 Tax=Eleusine coracana subsp. coracana TaxID=191504 RepID=A0AAV5C9J6_ELECO|nr:hypothetical protein PR202_ga11636 [Eleusine coracana subsp. coracana]